MPNLADEAKGLVEEFLKAHPPDSRVLNHVVKCCLLERMHNKEFKRLYLHLCPSIVKIEAIFCAALEKDQCAEQPGRAPKGDLERRGQEKLLQLGFSRAEGDEPK